MSEPLYRIVVYRPEHRAAWKALNEAWLHEGGFRIEDKDRKVLGDPEGQVLSQGGHIFIVEREDGTAAGCCALMAMDDGLGFEVAKMTISPEARGGGLAMRLLEACEVRARAVGAHRLYLETSSTLGPALALYARFGFVHLPPQPTPYARADVWMEKRL